MTPPGVLFRAIALAALLATTGAASAQAESYPTRPITVVVPFPAGGSADATARPLAIPLGRALGQTVVVDNRSGAGGAIGSAAVARAKPDGYTLLMALSSLTVIPEAERAANRPAPFEMRHFIPLARITAEPNVLIVRADARWRTLTDLVTEAKQRPGGISYSSSGVSGVTHLGVEIFALAAGVTFLHAPYQGGHPSMNALLVGEVDFTWQAPSVVLPHVSAGKVRALATSGGERLIAFPDVPTLTALGLDAEYVPWGGLFAPAETPGAVIERLRAAIRDAVADRGFQNAMANQGTPVRHLDGPAYEAFVATETRRAADIVRRVGKLE